MRYFASGLHFVVIFIFLTAKDSEDDIQAELAAGAVGHITKPLSPAQIVKRIKTVLGI